MIWTWASWVPALWPFAGFRGWLLSVVIVVAVGGTFSYRSQQQAETMLDILVAGDVPLENLPQITGTIAWFPDTNSSYCDEICQRQLLGGAATKVIIGPSGTTTNLNSPPGPS